MKRLVFCDLDGTLLPQGSRQIRKEVLDAIGALIKKGTLFCVASGRPYNELKPLFFEHYRNIIFICLDGAIVMHGDCCLYKNRLCKNETARLLTLSNGGAVYGRTETALIKESDNASLIKEKINRLGSEVFKVALLGVSPQSTARVCYNKGGITEYVSSTADKAAAARVVMDKFSVTAENTVALGDGENDVSLLKAVAKPYKMETSPALDAYPYPTVLSVSEWLKSI